MSAALTILLLTIADREVADPFTPAVTRATHEALGAETQVVSRSVQALPSDSEAAVLGTEVHADAVVEVKWSLPDHLHASIHLRRSSTGRWVDREIGFWPADDPVERSRTIGFTVASMLPERLVQPDAPPVIRPEAPSASVDETARSQRTKEDGLYHPRSIAAVFVAGLGVRDDGGGIGGALDFRARLSRAFSFRIGVGAREGQDPPAQLVTRSFYGGTGIAWDGWTSQNARGALGLRLDALAVRADFGHTSPATGTTVHQAKWMPGADLLIEATYFFSRGAAFVAGAGAGAVFGKTDIVIDGLRVGTVQPVRPMLEVGLRAGF